MMPVTRYDRGELLPGHRTAEGYLFFDGYATRAGVFIYRRADGTEQRELRPPEEVGNPLSLSTLARKPVTDLHPESFVDASNVAGHGVGVVDPDVIWEHDFADGFVRVRGTVQRKDAVASIDAGRVQLSAGYTADLEPAPPGAVWTDSEGRAHPYDAIQRNIRYNHLALVDKGRAGPVVRLRTDSAAAAQVTDEAPSGLPWALQDPVHNDGAGKLRAAVAKKVANGMKREEVVAKLAKAAGISSSTVNQLLAGDHPPSEETLKAFRQVLGADTQDSNTIRSTPMKTIKVDGREFSVEEPHALQRAIDEMVTNGAHVRAQLVDANAKLDAASTKLEEAVAQGTTAQAELDAMKADAASNNTPEPPKPEALIAYANERLQLMGVAQAMKLDGYSDPAKVEADNDGIKLAIVTAHLDGEDLGDKLQDSTYVDAVYDYLRTKGVKAHQDSTQALAANLLKSEQSRGDGSDEDRVAKAHTGYTERLNDAWKINQTAT